MGLIQFANLPIKNNPQINGLLNSNIREGFLKSVKTLIPKISALTNLASRKIPHRQAYRY